MIAIQPLASTSKRARRLVPAASGESSNRQWRVALFSPNSLPGTSAETSNGVSMRLPPRSLICRRREPTTRGGGSVGRNTLTVDAHFGHVSTSVSAPKTEAAGRSICTRASIRMVIGNGHDRDGQARPRSGAFVA